MHTAKKLELLTVIGAIVILAYITAISTVALYEIDTPPDDIDRIIKVTGRQFFWTFEMPDGTISNEVRIKTGETILFEIRAEDVIHSFFLREMAIKQDAVPGHVTTLWIRVDKPGEYNILCAELCGTGHTFMTTKLIVTD